MAVSGSGARAPPGAPVSRSRALARHPGIAIGTWLEHLRWRFDNWAHAPSANRVRGGSNAEFLGALLGFDRSEAERRLAEVPTGPLVEEITHELASNSLGEFPEARPPQGPWLGVLEILYATVRYLRPERVVETGVGLVGTTSTFFLAALAANDHGELWSIDLDRYFPLFGVHVGRGIPERLRARHHLVPRPARDVLGEVLRQGAPPGIFLHDGLHTYANMLYELRTAWPALPAGGLLFADDLDNSSLEDVAFGPGLRPLFLGYEGNCFGGIRRP
jgi:Methyltransferase domain